MLSGDVVALALDRFRSHTAQTWLTLVGLVVGTAAIILIVSLGLTGRGFVMAQIEGVGSQLIWATYEGTESAGVSRNIDDHINEGDIRAVEARVDLFTHVTPLVRLRGRVTVLARSKDVTVLGTTPNYSQTRKNIRVLNGRFLDDHDLMERSKVCVASRQLYDELFRNDDSSEKTIRTLGMTFYVVGEFEEPVDTLGQGDVQAETIFIPVTVAWFFTPIHKVDTLFADVREFPDIPRSVDELRTILRDRHRPGAVYTIESMTTVIKVAQAISFGLIVVFILAAGVSVVVGGVGIMNILLASVEQRTREIGLRLSVGARRRDILGQFLFEALLLGVMGSLLGVAGGLGVPILLRLLLPKVHVEVSLLSAVLAFFFSCLVTVLFGVVPAYRASHLNPTEALRHE